MVAPLVMSRPTRVFARLTFTGESKIASPVCCDLSRVASIVPANPLPFNVGGSANMKPENHIPSLAKDTKLSVLCNNSQATTHAKKLESEPVPEVKLDTAIAVPVAIPGNTSETPLVSGASRGIKRNLDDEETNEPNSKSFKDESSSKIPCGSSSGTSSSSAEIHPMDVLATENRRLKEQNAILIRKVHAFQQILRSEHNFELAVKKLQEMENASKAKSVLSQ